MGESSIWLLAYGVLIASSVGIASASGTKLCLVPNSPVSTATARAVRGQSASTALARAYRASEESCAGTMTKRLALSAGDASDDDREST